MQRLLLVLAAILTFASVTAQAQPQPKPQPCELVVDASASMQGFLDSQQPPALAPDSALSTLIDGLRQRCPKAYRFGQALDPLPLGAPLQFREGLTNIGGAVEQWLARSEPSSELVLLTDNVADDGSASGAANPATDRFYELLRRPDSPFSSIVVFAVRAPFRGPLYGIHNEVAQYPGGPRAFTLYMLGRRASSNDAFSRLRSEVEALLKAQGRNPFGSGTNSAYASYVMFDVKPFAFERFSARTTDVSIDNPEPTSTTRCSGQVRFDRPTQTFELIGQPVGDPCSIRATLTVRMSDRWCLVDAALHAEVHLGAGDAALRGGAVGGQVAPSTATLCDNNQVLRVTLRFDPYQYTRDTDFLERVRRTFRGAVEVRGRIDVIGTVERQRIDLGAAIKAQWSFSDPSRILTPTADAQSAVYRLDDMVRAEIPELDLRRTLTSYPIRVQLRYPQTPIVQLLGLLLLALIAATLLFLLVRRPLLLLVELDDGSVTQVRLPLFTSRTIGSAPARITLTYLGLLIRVGSQARISRGRVLPTSGGSVVLELGAPPRRRGGTRSSRVDEDDFDTVFEASEPVTFVVRARTSKGNLGRQVVDESY